MKYQLSALLLFSLIFTSHAYADCQPLYQNEITRISDRLIGFKKKEKVIEIGTAIGVGAPIGILAGVAFGLITDGATIPGAIFTGALFGTVAGGFATGAVAVPLITYNQIQKARIRALKNIVATLDEAHDLIENGKHLKKLLKKMRHVDSELDMAHLIQALNIANSQNLFCNGSDPLDHMRQLKQHMSESLFGID